MKVGGKKKAMGANLIGNKFTDNNAAYSGGAIELKGKLTKAQAKAALLKPANLWANPPVLKKLSAMKIVVKGNIFNNCSAAAGGAIHAGGQGFGDGVYSEITNNRFRNCRAKVLNAPQYGGAIAIEGLGNAGSVIAENDFSLCRADDGGCIALKFNVAVTLRKNTFRGSGATPANMKGVNASGSGGALYATMFSLVIIEDCTFVKNAAKEHGGAIDITAGTIVRCLGRNVFTDNAALGRPLPKPTEASNTGFGGAIHVANSRLSIEGKALFERNTSYAGLKGKAAFGYGGALCVHARVWPIGHTYQWENSIPAVCRVVGSVNGDKRSIIMSQNVSKFGGGGAVAGVRHHHPGKPKNIVKLDIMACTISGNKHAFKLAYLKNDSVDGIFYKQVADKKFVRKDLEKVLAKGLKDTLGRITVWWFEIAVDELAKNYVATYLAKISNAELLKDRLQDSQLLKNGTGYQYAIFEPTKLVLKNNVINPNKVYP